MRQSTSVRQHQRTLPGGRVTTVTRHTRGYDAASPQVTRSLSKNQSERILRFNKLLRESPDEQAVRELELYTENDYQIYKSMLEPIENNLKKKILNGTYNSDAANLAFLNAVNEANRRYKKEYGYSFDTASRARVASNMREFFEDEYRNR